MVVPVRTNGARDSCGSVCLDRGVARVPKNPVAVAFALYKVWSALPPAQRQRVLEAARKHGPTVAAKARRHGPSVVRAVARPKQRP
jgi:hypothetical protein